MKVTGIESYHFALSFNDIGISHPVHIELDASLAIIRVTQILKVVLLINCQEHFISIHTELVKASLPSNQANIRPYKQMQQLS